MGRDELRSSSFPVLTQSVPRRESGTRPRTATALPAAAWPANARRARRDTPYPGRAALRAASFPNSPFRFPAAYGRGGENSERGRAQRRPYRG